MHVNEDLFVSCNSTQQSICCCLCAMRLQISLHGFFTILFSPSLTRQNKIEQQLFRGLMLSKNAQASTSITKVWKEQCTLCFVPYQLYIYIPSFVSFSANIGEKGMQTFSLLFLCSVSIRPIVYIPKIVVNCARLQKQRENGKKAEWQKIFFITD